MKMSDPSIERQLQEFLAWQERARKENKTIESLHDKQDDMMRTLKRVTRDRLEDRETIRRHGRAIKTLQHQVGLLTEASPSVPHWHPPKEEVTATHSVTALAKAQAELEERIDAYEERRVEEETWWRRQRWVWAVGAFGAFLAIVMTGCVGYVAYRVQAIEKSLAPNPSERRHLTPQ